MERQPKHKPRGSALAALLLIQLSLNGFLHFARWFLLAPCLSEDGGAVFRIEAIERFQCLEKVNPERNCLPFVPTFWGDCLSVRPGTFAISGKVVLLMVFSKGHPM